MLRISQLTLDSRSRDDSSLEAAGFGFFLWANPRRGIISGPVQAVTGLVLLVHTVGGIAVCSHQQQSYWVREAKVLRATRWLAA